MQCSYYPQLNASLQIPSSFIAEIIEIANNLHNEKTGDWTGIQNRLESAIIEKWHKLLYLGKNIVEIINSEEGFVVVKNLPFLLYERPVIDLLFLSLSTCLGKLTVHDDSKKIVWDVTPRHHTSERTLTFSELDGEAPLHTDSAFRKQPEEYFGLLVVAAAKIGGNSVLMRVDKVIQSLERSDLGSRCLAILRSDFPFRVPPAFANAENTKTILAPIIADSPVIRFRLDSIISGFKCYSELATPQRLWALNYFNSFIESYRDKIEFKLNDGDIIFVNNYTMLHSRTAFRDSHRLLLRVRVEKNALS